MAKAKRAVSLGVSTVIVIVIILIVGFGVYLNDTFNTTNTSRSSSSSSIVGGTTTSPSTGRDYQVTFNQIAACKAFPPAFWGIPWSVTIGNTTMVEPPGTPLPLNNGGSVQGTFDEALSNITFNLPNGTYSYVVSPTFEFFTPDSGNVTVAGSNVTVPIEYSGTSCSEALTTSSSSITSASQSANTSTTSAIKTSTASTVLTQGGVASLVLTSPEVLSYVEPAYTYDLSIVQDPFAANLANALINVTETQSVSGNWTGSGYEVTYSGIMLNATVQFTSPSSYQLVSVGVTNLPNKTYSISYNSQQQHIIQVALSNSTVDSLVSDFTKYYVNEVSGLVGNGTGFYYVSIPQVDGPKAVSVSVNAAMTAVISATSGYNGGGVCFYNPYFCYTVPWNSTTG